MKKRHFILCATLLFNLLSVALFSSCDRDTNSYLDVKVVEKHPITQALMPVPGAEVEIYQDGGTVNAKGFTGNNGVYSTHFVAPAIVSIRVKLDVYNENGVRVGERRANGSVRLTEGETKTTQLTLSDQIFY